MGKIEIRFDETVTELVAELESAVEQAIEDYLDDKFPGRRHPTIGSRAVAVALTRITERWLRKPAAVAADAEAAGDIGAVPAARGPAPPRGHWVCTCAASPKPCYRTGDGPDGLCTQCRDGHTPGRDVKVDERAVARIVELQEMEYAKPPPRFELTPEQAAIFLIYLDKYPQWQYLRNDIRGWLARPDVVEAYKAEVARSLAQPQNEEQAQREASKHEMEEGR